MDNPTSIAIKREFPELASGIMAAADLDASLKQALQDFQHADERANDAQSPTGDRILWSEIRAELAIEIERLYAALAANVSNTE